MKVTFLGQAGLLFETEQCRIMIDPYFSDSVEKINPQNYRRKQVNRAYLEVKPNVMIFTHNHLDHYDPETVRHFITEERALTVLAPESVWNDVRKLGGNHNYVMFNRHTCWTEYGIRFTAVKAEHSDAFAIGVILEAEGRKYYITGDTLYNTEIFADIPQDIYALFLPINGKGNNMNMEDAAHFAEQVGAEKVVPIHIGMFDELKAEDFVCSNKVTLEMWEEVTWNN